MLIRLIFPLFIILTGEVHAQVNDSERPGVEKFSTNEENETQTEEKNAAVKADKDDDTSHARPPKLGNFSLPSSQQPAALFGFGGNIIDKNEVQLYFFADEFYGKKKLSIDLIPSVLFGVTDTFSLFFNTPVTPQFYDDPHRSRGLEDFFIQAEYAFYNHTTYTSVDQATLVANVTYPTGSIHKKPPTGFGSPSVFLGATYYHVLVDWLFFTSNGAILTTSDHGNKFGGQFLYQCGMGRNFCSPEGWIYAWLLEVDGQYGKRNRICGHIDPNSGGNFIYVTPSLWVSSKDVLVQFGFSIPINQNLFGHQNKFDFGLNLNCAWSFY